MDRGGAGDGLRLGRIGFALLALAVYLLAAAPAEAEREYDLPSHITIETRAFDFPNDHDRCVAWAFAEFPEIPQAKGYELTVADTVHGTQQTFSDPEFPDDTWSDYPALYEVHKGFHWFALSGYSVGSGCADAILGLEDAYEIVRSKVHLDRKYEKRLRPKKGVWRMQRCHGTGGKLPRLGKSGEALVLVKVGVSPQGVSFGPEGERPNRLHDGAFINEATIVKTDRHSAVMVAEPWFDSLWGPIPPPTDALIFGPGMEVRLEPGKRPEVLHRDPDASWDDVKPVRYEGHVPAQGDTRCPAARG